MLVKLGPSLDSWSESRHDRPACSEIRHTTDQPVQKADRQDGNAARFLKDNRTGHPVADQNVAGSL